VLQLLARTIDYVLFYFMGISLMVLIVGPITLAYAGFYS
jgi:hypothetical protein